MRKRGKQVSGRFQLRVSHGRRTCSRVAGRPINSFAPHMAVAALALPPPNPAWAGTCLIKLARNLCCVMPVFSLISCSARSTKLLESVGTPSMLHVNSSPSSFASSFDSSNLSPKPIAWNRLAKSWYPSGLLRMIRRNRLILHGLNSEILVGGGSCDAFASGEVLLVLSATFDVAANILPLLPTEGDGEKARELLHSSRPTTPTTTSHLFGEHTCG